MLSLNFSSKAQQWALNYTKDELIWTINETPSQTSTSAGDQEELHQLFLPFCHPALQTMNSAKKYKENVSWKLQVDVGRFESKFLKLLKR